MFRKTSHEVILFLRSLDCEYVTRAERARFRDQVIETSETMLRADVEPMAMMRQANYVSHEGRYILLPTEDGGWRLLEDLSPGALPRSIVVENEWREATEDEIAAVKRA